MAKINSDQYIGNDQALAMQAQATQTVAQAAQEGIKRSSDGIQSYLTNATQNSQRMIELEQARAHVIIQKSQQPNAFVEAAKAGLSVYEGYRQKKEQTKAVEAKAAAELAKDQAAIASSQKYVKAEDEITNLLSVYRNSNWDKGTEAYKRDAAEILTRYTPNTPEEAKEFQRVTQGVNSAYLSRNLEVNQKLEKKQDETLNYQTDIIKSGLRQVLVSQLTWLAKGDFADQGMERLISIGNTLENFLKDDNGLPYNKKLSIVAELSNEAITKYGNKLERYVDYKSNLRDYNEFAVYQLANEQAFAAGQKTYEEYQQANNSLELRFPGMGKLAIKRGDRERLELSLTQITAQQRELNEQGVSTSANNYGFTPEDTKSLVASAYVDPIFRETLANHPLLKDNPSIKAAISISARIKSFAEEQTKVENNQASINTGIAKTNLQSIDAYASTVRDIAKKQANQQQLTPIELTLLALQGKFSPEVRQVIQAKVQGQQIDIKELNRANDYFSAGVNDIIRQQQQEINVQRSGLVRDYYDLLNLGFIDGNGKINERALNSYSKSAPAIIDKARQNIERTRLELQQQLQPPPNYGIQPNFNPSSTYAPLLDDKGNLALPPRTSLSTMRLSDGSNIVTPVVMGQGGQKTSDYGWRNHPVTGGKKFHAGIDIGAPMGAKSVSLVSGTVAWVGELKGYGGVVDILGDNGILYRYAHQRPLVKSGQRLTPGQLVAESNGSGVGTGAHLHLEVRQSPRIVNGRYSATDNLGQTGTIDPLEHLKQLNAGNRNVLAPRGNTLATNSTTARVPANSTLTSNGGAINGQTYQRVGSVPGELGRRFGNQRHIHTGTFPYISRVGTGVYNDDDDMGYAVLRQKSALRQQFVATAKKIGVPPQWIADIAAQESGGIQEFMNHRSPNGNYGLFGFGNDSFSDKRIHSRLISGQIDGVGQLKLLESYLSENGWQRLVKQRQGNISVADLWSFIRFGTRTRQKFQETKDINIKTEGGLTYADELKLLGKHVGRQYELPGISRKQRNRAASDRYQSSCQLCNQLALSDTFTPHIHT